MPRGGSARNSGGSKLRFVMLEADLADGDLSQIAQAITSALKPASVAQRLRAGPAAQKALSAPGLDEQEFIEVEDEEEVLELAATSSSIGRSRARVYKEPKRLDIDISAFKDFAIAKAPEGTMDKHLVAAVWFKLFFNTTNVTIDHAYSAYLEAGWSTSIQDFDDPFRKLVGKKRGLMKRVSKGEYEATFPGINAVREMGQSVAEPNATSGLSS